MKTHNRSSATVDEMAMETVEWIDGERITLEEYESRLRDRASLAASKYLLHISKDWDWLFGIE